MFGLTPFGGASFGDAPFLDINNLSDLIVTGDGYSSVADFFSSLSDSLSVVETVTVVSMSLVASLDDNVTSSDTLSAVMDSGKTRWGRKYVLDHFLGKTSYPFGDIYAALFSTDPSAAGDLSGELTEAGYSRVEMSSKFNDANLTTGQTDNSADVIFGPAGEDWPDIRFIGFMNAATGGTMIYYGEAVLARSVKNTDSFKIPAGTLVIEEN